MVTNPRWLGCLLLGGTLVPTAAAYEGVTQVGDAGERLVAFVRQAHEEAGFSGAVLAGQGGKVIAAVAVGTLSEKSKKPITVETLFEIASCTKPFTAVAVMRLAEEGKLSLDDSIAKHLPGVPADCKEITVRHLLQHTSGIPRDNSRGRGTDLAVVLPTFLEGGPRTPPGERHAYWNQGYSLLSEVIARASGKPYTDYVREAIFEPCRMTSSCFTGDRRPAGVPVATGASQRGAPRTALEHPYGEYGFQYRGMGGLVTNLIDLWRFDRTLARGKLLSKASIEEMTRPGPSGYALGWRIGGPDGRVHYHTGSVRGFLASIRRDPADDACLFVLANSDDTGPFNRVKAGCEAILAGGDATLVAYQPIAEETATELAGVYHDAKGRTLRVAMEKGVPRAEIDWGGVSTHAYLLKTDTDRIRFSMRPAEVLTPDVNTDTLDPERDDAGRVAALTLTITVGETKIRFARDTP